MVVSIIHSVCLTLLCKVKHCTHCSLHLRTRQSCGEGQDSAQRPDSLWRQDDNRDTSIAQHQQNTAQQLHKNTQTHQHKENYDWPIRQVLLTTFAFTWHQEVEQEVATLFMGHRYMCTLANHIHCILPE